MFNFNTDLADERRDIFRKANNLEEIPGIETETIEEDQNIKTNRVKIIDNQGAQAIGKPMGTYITIDIKNLKLNIKKPPLLLFLVKKVILYALQIVI